MLLNELRRFIVGLIRPRQPLDSVSPDHPMSAVASAVTATSNFEVDLFDPTWHGDHWQNLLSSPMDARRYVMEDWSVTVDPELIPAYRIAPAP